MLEAKVMKSSVAGWVVWPIVTLLAGCWHGPESADSLGALEDESPAVRIRAIKWAGQNGASAAVPLLVDRLMDEDQVVRFYAIESLKRITGSSYGYDYKGDAVERARAVRRWRQAIDREEDALP